MAKKWISYSLPLIGVPLLILFGTAVFKGRQSAYISLVIVIASMIPLFMTFEKKNDSTRKLVLIAVMTALSVVGRVIFAVLPGFKPVTAVVVLTAIFFGSEAGFLTGALSAFISNFYFGQGPWTPFQMFSWGLLGLLAGLLAKPLKSNRALLALYGAFAGVAYSFVVDIWTVLWYDNTFHFKLYLAALASAPRFTASYVLSNIVFLLLLIKPIGEKLERIKIKYGL